MKRVPPARARDESRARKGAKNPLTLVTMNYGNIIFTDAADRLSDDEKSILEHSSSRIEGIFPISSVLTIRSEPSPINLKS